MTKVVIFRDPRGRSLAAKRATGLIFGVEVLPTSHYLPYKLLKKVGFCQFKKNVFFFPDFSDGRAARIPQHFWLDVVAGGFQSPRRPAKIRGKNVFFFNWQEPTFFNSLCGK